MLPRGAGSTSSVSRYCRWASRLRADSGDSTTCSTTSRTPIVANSASASTVPRRSRRALLASLGGGAGGAGGAAGRPDRGGGAALAGRPPAVRRGAGATATLRSRAHDHSLRYGRRPPSIANESRRRSPATGVPWSGPARAGRPRRRSRPSSPVRSGRLVLACGGLGRGAAPSSARPAGRRRAPAAPAGTGPWCARPAASGSAGRARPPCARAACTPARRRCRRSHAGRVLVVVPVRPGVGRRKVTGRTAPGLIGPGAVVRRHVAACCPTVLCSATAWTGRVLAVPLRRRPACRRRPRPARSRPARRWPASARR